MSMPEMTFAQAVNAALVEEMRRDPNVYVIGEDVAEAGTPFKVLSGLVEEFGPERVIDSPISEAGVARPGPGAGGTRGGALGGIMFGGFMTLGLDQGAEQGAEKHNMSGG